MTRNKEIKKAKWKTRVKYRNDITKCTHGKQQINMDGKDLMTFVATQAPDTKL